MENKEYIQKYLKYYNHDLVYFSSANAVAVKVINEIAREFLYENSTKNLD